MSTRVLVAYASKRGSTEEVARRIAETLHQQGFATETTEAARVSDLDRFDAVVLGGSLYMGRWHGDARRFLRRHRKALAALPLAVFALGPGEDTEKDFASSRHQLDYALAHAKGIEPRAIEIFGGVIDPDRLSFLFNHMPRVDIRNWDRIDLWASSLPVELGLVREAVEV